MWTDQELADWEGTYLRSADSSRRAALDSDLARVVVALDETDREAAIARMVLDSLRLARSALPIAADTDAFRDLPKDTPFHFWATPGHDEPTIELWIATG